jgi:mRNA interferase HigB
MRVISREPLRNFAAKHPQASQLLDAWYRRVRHAAWQTPADVKRDYGTADILPDNRIVFDIGGNNYRLIVRMNYHRQAIYIRFIGTHAEYDRIDATTV